MNELSDRLKQAVSFIKKNGYARNNREIARRLGVTESTLCMVTNGTRVPTLEHLAIFSDTYPVDFQWLRTGAGTMIKEDRELALLKRIAELEREIERLKG